MRVCRQTYTILRITGHNVHHTPTSCRFSPGRMVSVSRLVFSVSMSIALPPVMTAAALSLTPMQTFSPKPMSTGQLPAYTLASATHKRILKPHSLGGWRRCMALKGGEEETEAAASSSVRVEAENSIDADGFTTNEKEQVSPSPSPVQIS